MEDNRIEPLSYSRPRFPERYDDSFPLPPKNNQLFEALYRDSIVPYGSRNLQNKTFHHGKVDSLAPYAPPYDRDKYTVTKSLAPLKIAQEEKPKTHPVDAKLEVKAPVLEPKSLLSNVVSKGFGIGNIFKSIYNFVSEFVSDVLFGKKSDEDKLESKLQPPEVRNAAALAECLKSLNQKLQQMRDTVQNDVVADNSTDLQNAACYLVAIEIVKKLGEHYNRDNTFLQKEIIEIQEKSSLEQKKMFEALNGTMQLPKLTKWVLKPLELFSTAAAIAAFGLIGASIVAGLVTGGVSAVVGSVASVAGYFVVIQAISILTSGVVAIIKAFAEHKRDRHQGVMIKIQHDRDLLSFLLEQASIEFIDQYRQASHLVTQLSQIQKQRSQAVIAQFKN